MSMPSGQIVSSDLFCTPAACRNVMQRTKKAAAPKAKRVPVKRPKIKSEAEQVAGWEANPEFIAAQFQKASTEGRVIRGLPGHSATRSRAEG
jgi:hypothetical protein